MTNEAAAVEISQLTFRYPSAVSDALTDVSVTIDKGSFVSLVGPNGGGKTTMIRLLLGLHVPTTGTIHRHINPIGYVPQRSMQDSIVVPFTVGEVVLSGRAARRKIGRLMNHDDQAIVQDVLEQLKIADLRDTPIDELSGGQRQRAYIARALVNEPAMLILDEPTVGIDAPSENEFYQILGTLQKEKNVTILFVTHDIDVVSSLSDHVLCLNRTLRCNLPAGTFTKQQYLTSVYDDEHHIPVHHTC